MGEGELVSEDISVRTFLKWVFREEEGLCYLNHVSYFNESLLLFFFFLIPRTATIWLYFVGRTIRLESFPT